MYVASSNGGGLPFITGSTSNQDVGIDGREYEATSVLNLSLAAEIAENAVDAEFPITDDILLQPPVFRVTLKLFDRYNKSQIGGLIDSTRIEQYQRLKDLWLGKRLFKFINDFGIFDNCVIETFEVTESNESSNTFDAELTIKVIAIARLLPAYFQFIIDEDGNIIGVEPGEGGLKEVPLTRPDATPQEDPSMLDELISWWNGWWPWG